MSPLWVTLLEWAVKALVFCYGHPAVLEHVVKATPLTPDVNPPLSQENNPNLKDHYGG